MQHRSWIVIGATFAVCVLHAGTGWCQRSESHEVAVRGASAYVPVESYAYTLFDRLAAEGLIETQFVGVRPWTCTQCARLVAEADSKAGPENSLQQQVLKQLRHEFAPELEGAHSAWSSIDEVYVRSVTIGGEPLTDYHFGRTTYNDHGRPSSEGENAFIGFRGTQAWKSLVFHLQGEYQHAAAPPALSSPQQNVLNTVDEFPAGTPRPVGHVDRFRWIEAYAGMRFKNMNVTVGKQALWWGPSPNSAMLYSTNAEPIYMLRVQQDAPIRLPWLLRYLGPMRWDSFFGKLDGHRFPADPYLHGQKISFKPTPNFELGFSRTVEFAGAGHGLTFETFWRSFISVGDKLSATPGSLQDVGDRRGGFDFTYRVPGVRDRVTLYGDFFTDDDPSPLAATRRSAMLPGIYVSRLPFSERLDLRVEALVTDQNATHGYGGRFFYFNSGYKDGYTNNGQIIGSWIGRDAKAIIATSRYWLSPIRDFCVTYRNVKTDSSYLPGGGTQHDVRFTMRSTVGERFRVEGFVQYEQWRIPVLAPGTTRNTSAGLLLGYLR